MNSENSGELEALLTVFAVGGCVPRVVPGRVHLPFVLGPPSMLPRGALSWGVFVCLMSL